MTNQAIPNSSAFFKGQIDAQNGVAAPRKPASNAAFDEHLYFRGFMQQMRKDQKTGDFANLNMAW
jgi:hypothetical protein